MNRRNFEIFGVAKKTKYIVLGAVLLVIIWLAWLSMSGETLTAAVVNQPSNQLTGAVVQQQEQQNQEQQQITQEEQIEEQVSEEQRPYYTYEGQCAFDLKQRQDDLTEATTVVDQYQQEIDGLNEEYEQKKKEIEEQYVPEIGKISTKKENAQKDLSEAQRRFDTTKATCDPHPPH